MFFTVHNLSSFVQTLEYSNRKMDASVVYHFPKLLPEPRQNWNGLPCTAQTGPNQLPCFMKCNIDIMQRCGCLFETREAGSTQCERHNLPHPLVWIGLTDLPNSPIATPLAAGHSVMSSDTGICNFQIKLHHCPVWIKNWSKQTFFATY